MLPQSISAKISIVIYSTKSKTTNMIHFAIASLINLPIIYFIYKMTNDKIIENILYGYLMFLLILMPHLCIFFLVYFISDIFDKK